MPRIGIHIGEDFPVEDVAESARTAEGRGSDGHEERERVRAFRERIRRHSHGHSGDHAFAAFVLGALLAITLLALALAALPRAVVLAILALGFIYAVAHRARGRRRPDFQTPWTHGHM